MNNLRNPYIQVLTRTTIISDVWVSQSTKEIYIRQGVIYAISNETAKITSRVNFIFLQN